MDIDNFLAFFDEVANMEISKECGWNGLIFTNEDKSRIIWGLGLLINMYKDCISEQNYTIAKGVTRYFPQERLDEMKADRTKNRKEVKAIQKLKDKIERGEFK